MSKKRVLVPHDGSAFCRQIYPQIQSFLDPEKHELILLRVGATQEGHVGAPPRPAGTDMSVMMYDTHQDAEFAAHPIYASQVMESAAAVIRAELADDINTLEAAGFEVELAVRFGNDRGETIVEYVAERQIDLVAITTHWRRGLPRLIFGSVAQYLVSHIAIPVLMIAPKEDNN
jgi:nucleotide-binding universal stress UspA family protein